MHELDNSLDFGVATTRETKILVDDRERGSGVVEILRARENIQVEIQRLALGDYLIDDALLIERKTLPDLVASIKDGRLFSQACRLAVAPVGAMIILEGKGADLADSGMRREAIQGALVTLTLFLGIPLLRSLGPVESAGLMLLAANQRRRFAAGALPRHGSRPRGKYRVQARLLQGLPRVGPQRAKRLLERFGSVEAVMTAEAEALAEVPGIGTGTAKAIRWAVEETAAGYADAASEFFPF